jgi:hypothetical protein
VKHTALPRQSRDKHNGKCKCINRFAQHTVQSTVPGQWVCGFGADSVQGPADDTLMVSRVTRRDLGAPLSTGRGRRGACCIWKADHLPRQARHKQKEVGHTKTGVRFSANSGVVLSRA